MSRKRIATPVPVPGRVRGITGSFAWLDHRLMRNGHLRRLTRDGIALYTFLVLAADRNGVSFYRMEKICEHLDYMSWPDFKQALDELIAEDLVAFHPFAPHLPNGYYQVLSLEHVRRPLEQVGRP